MTYASPTFDEPAMENVVRLKDGSELRPTWFEVNGAGVLWISMDVGQRETQWFGPGEWLTIQRREVPR